MSRFTYIRPDSLPETLELLADLDQASRLLAGGTDLLIRLRRQEPDFDRIIDVSRLPELKIIAREGDEMRLGGGVTYTELIKSELIQTLTPLLADAARQVGGPQVRNQGTIGGNIVNAAGGADMLPPLTCLDATVHLASARGQRSFLLSDFILHPARTHIRRDEVLTHLSFLAPPPGARSVFLKLGRQRVSSVARLLVAAIGRVDATGRIDFIRFAPGAVTPQVQRFAAVEALLLGETPAPELFERAGAQASQTMQSLAGERWSSPYKTRVLHTLTVRALTQIFS